MSLCLLRAAVASLCFALALCACGEVRYEQDAAPHDAYSTDLSTVDLPRADRAVPVACGDKVCGPGENVNNCPADCPAACGDTICSAVENASSCPADCQAVCGDGYCTHTETATSCYQDCAKQVFLTSVGDTFLRQGDPNGNYGGSNDLAAGSGEITNGARRVLIKFDLTIAGCSIQSAVLHLYLYKEYGTTSPSLSAHAVTAKWTTYQATWKVRSTGVAWSSSGGDHATAANATTKITSGSWGWKTWDVTALAMQWAASPSKNFGLIIREANDHLAGSGRKYFRSSNYSNAAQRPTLRLTCSP